MYEEEEEEQVVKVIIPKYTILHSDLEVIKKDSHVLDVSSDSDRSVKNANNISERKENIMNRTEKILEYATKSLEGTEFDKDIATKLKKFLDEDTDLNNPSVTNAEKNIEEFGVWHVIVGRQFIASVSFDAKYLIYFLFDEIGKYFLVFRS